MPLHLGIEVLEKGFDVSARGRLDRAPKRVDVLLRNGRSPRSLERNAWPEGFPSTSRGIAADAGLVALAPVVAKGVGKLARAGGVNGSGPLGVVGACSALVPGRPTASPSDE